MLGSIFLRKWMERFKVISLLQALSIWLTHVHVAFGHSSSLAARRFSHTVYLFNAVGSIWTKSRLPCYLSYTPHALRDLVKLNAERYHLSASFYAIQVRGVIADPCASSLRLFKQLRETLSLRTENTFVVHFLPLVMPQHQRVQSVLFAWATKNVPKTPRYDFVELISQMCSNGNLDWQSISVWTANRCNRFLHILSSLSSRSCFVS